jgi:hypothetical protein
VEGKMLSPRKSENFKLLATGKIDGGAYRWIKFADGSGRVEAWTDKGWEPGGASLREIADAPPVSPMFAARLGIPLADVTAIPEAGYRPAPISRELRKLIEERGRERQAKLIDAKPVE